MHQEIIEEETVIIEEPLNARGNRRPQTARQHHQSFPGARPAPPRAPAGFRTSTPQPRHQRHEVHQVFGPQTNYNVNWRPEHEQAGRRDPGVTYLSTSAVGAHSEGKSKTKTPPGETLMEWFDRSVEKELSKRRNLSSSTGDHLVNVDTSFPGRRGSSPFTSPIEAASSTSGIDISYKLQSAQNTELTDAVEKLAKAEAICSFAGAVAAAEAAAAAADPEYAEEAAAAGARDFQAEVTNIVQESILEPGSLRPIEVVGYVGITRSKIPKKPERGGKKT